MRKTHPEAFADSVIPFGAARAIILIAIIVFGGTLGFMIIERWDALDSFYMTVITLSTVGFREVRPLTASGKVFTCVLIIGGLSGATYAFSGLIRMIVEGELGRLREGRKMANRIANLQAHTIVCGFGQLGSILVRELRDAKQALLVIDNDPGKVSQIEATGVPFLIGNAYDDEVLRSANITAAKTLICLLPHVADSVYVTLCARDLNPDLTIIARTDDEGGEKNLRRAGADRVLSPYRVAGMRLAQQMLRPNVSDFLELAAGKGDARLAIEEITISASSPLSGQTLEQAELRRRTGAVVAAIVEPGGKTIVSPAGTSKIAPGSTMIVVGERESLGKLGELL